MKRLQLVKKIDGKSHVYSIYKAKIDIGYKEMLITTNKKNGLQDLYEILCTSTGEKYYSTACEDVSNKTLIRILQEDFKMVI